MWLIPTMLVFGGFGFLIGRNRKRGIEGLALGLLFGPIGWFLIFLLPIRFDRRCPDCRFGIPKSARKCGHCGSTV